jgi:DNA-binding transcriptional LysR family regulator
MKIRQVTYFLALCEEQSFTRAARRCGVAQPSLTRAIQLLEQEIGGRLFERNNSSVHLTELGALVHPDFVRISQSTDNIERMATNLLASSPDTSDQRPTEGFTRALSIGAATVSILAAGLALHPAPQATAPESAHAGTHADPFGLQSADGGHSLPTQKTEDLF